MPEQPLEPWTPEAAHREHVEGFAQAAQCATDLADALESFAVGFLPGGANRHGMSFATSLKAEEVGRRLAQVLALRGRKSRLQPMESGKVYTPIPLPSHVVAAFITIPETADALMRDASIETRTIETEQPTTNYLQGVPTLYLPTIWKKGAVYLVCNDFPALRDTAKGHAERLRKQAEIIRGYIKESAQADESHETYIRRKYGSHPIVHLRDVLAVLNPGLGQKGDYPDLETRRLALNLAFKMLRDAWEVPFDPEALAKYASLEALGRGIETIERIDTELPPGDYARIDDQIRRLHNAGFTVKIVEAVCRKYPETGKATGLDNARIGTKQQPWADDPLPANDGLPRTATGGAPDYAGYARALLEIQDKCREWGQVLRQDGWINGDTNTHKQAAQTPDAKAAELAVMALIKANLAALMHCRSSFPRYPSTPLDRAFDYIAIHLDGGPEALQHNPVALAECLAVEVAQPNVAELTREPTFIVQLGRWAQRLHELAALRQAAAPVSAPADGQSPPQANKRNMEKPWADDAPEYLPLTEARKLIDGRKSLSALSKLLTPDGEMRYMRKKGYGCKVHIADFRRYMQGRQSDPEWAAAYMNWLQGQKAGKTRLFWKCGKCGLEYPDEANATDHCPTCKSESALTPKTPPKPRR